MKIKKWIIGIVGILVLMCVGFALYTKDYYHADGVSIESNVEYIQETYSEKYVVYEPKNADVGFILYPGAKVQFESYAPLLQKIAEEGILTSVVYMPHNMAILDYDAAKDVMDMYPSIKTWYIGGHSLGGVMAGKYASENLASFKGIIFLASYTTSDISTTELSVLSIYGSEDKVLNKESYDENMKNLPANTVEYCIKGGNHANFGNYGQQEGDGQATISREEQQELTANKIIEFIHQ